MNNKWIVCIGQPGLSTFRINIFDNILLLKKMDVFYPIIARNVCNYDIKYKTILKLIKKFRVNPWNDVFNVSKEYLTMIFNMMDGELWIKNEPELVEKLVEPPSEKIVENPGPGPDPNSIIVKNNKNIELTITPISKDPKSESAIHYKEQINCRNSNLLWDDGKFNKAKEGEFFGFLFFNNKIRIHQICSVKSPAHRLPNWSKNVGQSHRNVVELSASFKELTWKEWQEIQGPEQRMGTYKLSNISSKYPVVFNMLKNII